MTDIQQQTRELLGALDRGEEVLCLHYACEGFQEVNDRPLAIAAIAVTEITDVAGERESKVFSIANAPANAESEEREKDMLRRFFAYAKSRTHARWVHWNMNSVTFGVASIEARYRYLFQEEPPSVFSSERLFDLDSIISARHGLDFAHHPKMRSLFSLNDYHLLFFKTGAEEAKAFSSGEYRACETSCAEKAQHMASALIAFRAGKLQTANSVGTVAFASGQLDAVEVIVTLGERFLYVERELQHRHGGRATLTVNDEYDSQDLCRSLLRIFFDDVRPEEFSPSYAGGASRIDFHLPEFELAVELKFTRDSLTDKSLGEQLIIDRDRYAAMRGIRHLVCLVFDHAGKLRNPRGLENDLERKASLEDFAVTVKIYDR